VLLPLLLLLPVHPSAQGLPDVALQISLQVPEGCAELPVAVQLRPRNTGPELEGRTWTGVGDGYQGVTFYVLNRHVRPELPPGEYDAWVGGRRLTTAAPILVPPAGGAEASLDLLGFAFPEIWFLRCGRRMEWSGYHDFDVYRHGANGVERVGGFEIPRTFCILAHPEQPPDHGAWPGPLPPGRYEVRARAMYGSRLRSWEIEVVAGWNLIQLAFPGRDVRFRLPPIAGFAPNTRIHEIRQPVQAIVLGGVRPEYFDEFLGGRYLRREGRVEIPDVDPGRYRVWFHSEPDGWWISPPFTVATASVNLGRVEPRPGSAVRVKMAQWQTHPDQVAVVSLQEVTTGWCPMFHLTGKNHAVVTFRNLPPGLYRAFWFYAKADGVVRGVSPPLVVQPGENAATELDAIPMDARTWEEMTAALGLNQSAR